MSLYERLNEVQGGAGDPGGTGNTTQSGVPQAAAPAGLSLIHI